MKTVFFFILLVIFQLSSSCFAQWGPDVRLTYSPFACSTTPGSGKSIVSDTSGFLHVAWMQIAGSGSSRKTLWYKRWRGIWMPPVQLTDSTVYGGALECSFSVTTNGLNEVHVVWTDIRNGYTSSEIYFRTSIDSGMSWMPEERLTDAPGKSVSPSLVALGATVHVSWIDYRDGPSGQVYYRKRDSGVWRQDTALTADSDTLSYSTIACDSLGRVFIAWWRARNRKGELWFKRFNGIAWEPGMRLSQDTLLNPGWSPYLPSMTVSGGGVIHLFWNSGDEEIYYKRSTDGGATWGPDVRLTYDPAESWWPSGGVGPGNRVQVVWADGRTNGMGDIFFKESTDGGQSWSPDSQLTTDSSESWCPSIAVDPRGGLHVVWMDSRDTVFQVYYKSRAPLGIEEGPTSFERLSFNLFQNAPNPWVRGTRFAYILPHEAQVVLRIYNPAGQLVRTLVSGKESAGYRQVDWDGRDDFGRMVPSGVYFYRLQAGAFSDTKKMVVIR
jgi:FlgD Ig-like domain